ncbi:MAG: hypothetical protein NTZ03_04980 [Actinobacteria bacterium]|nr:hypothetical protein [Actinomycetota bacterium]
MTTRRDGFRQARSFTIRALAVGASAVVVCAGLPGVVAPAGATPTVVPAAVAPTWDAARLPALAGSPSSGVRFTPLAGVVVPLRTLSESSSTVPTLRVDELTVASVRFRIRAVATDTVHESPVVSVVGGMASWTVPGGILATRQDYRVSVVNAANTASVVLPERLLVVDVQRSGQQQLWPFAGMSVAQVTGEPIAQWTSPGVSTLEGTAGYSLMFRPTSESQSGLPSGWELLPQGVDSGWKSLTVFTGGLRAKLTGWDGWQVTFEKSASGAFTADLGAHAGWPGGRITTLAAGDDGAWTATDSSQTVTTFPAHAVTSTFTVWPSKIWTYGMPSLQQSWANGKLDHITDPVSGRRIQFHYAPHATCPILASGFIGVPAGMLCSSTAWDGQKTDFSYVCVVATSPCPLGSAQVGRMTAYAGTGVNAQVTDVAWDRSARIVGMRQPLAAAAIAAGVVTPGGTALLASDLRAQTRISYDSNGRVFTITAPAGLVSGDTQTGAQQTRVTQTFAYSTQAGTPAGSPTLGVFTVTESGTSVPYVAQNAAELTTMDQRWSAGPSGRRKSATWNAVDEVSEVVDENSGTRSKTVYNSFGQPIKAIGPSKLAMTDTSGAPETKTQYDTYDADPIAGPTHVNMKPLEGVVLFSWDNLRTSGVPAHRSVGPQIGGQVPSSLGYVIASNPSGHGGQWSGRMTGRYVAGAAGTYRFRSLTGAELWVKGIVCTQAAPCSVYLAKGAAANLQIDVLSSTAGAVSLDVQVDEPGTPSWVAVPSVDLQPGLGQVTRVDVMDQRSSTGAAEDFYTMTTYDHTAGTSNPIKETSASGASGTFAWTPSTGVNGQWGQMASQTGPSGRTTSFSYYGGTQTAAGCTGDAVSQGGLLHQTTLPGGAASTQRYDASGGISEATGQGAKTCLTHGADGSISGGSVTDGAAAGYAASSNPMLDGNPLMSERTTIARGVTTTTKSEISITGSVFRTTDSQGTVTTYAYNPSSGSATIIAQRTAQGELRALTMGYDNEGQHTSTTLSGSGMSNPLRLETVSYSNGAITSVVYANATRSALALDDNNNVNRVTYSGFTGSKSVSETDTHSQENAILTRSLRDADGNTVNFAATYDLDHRLIRSTITGTIPVTTKSTTLNMTGTAGATGNRASETTVASNDASTTSTFTYDGADRLLSSTKPSLTSAISYDVHGRTTAIGSSTLGYDAGGRLITVAGTRGAVSFAGNGDIIFTPTAGSPITLRRSGDMLFDTDNNIVGQVIGLSQGVTVALDNTGTPVAWNYDDLQGSAAWSTTGSTSSPAPTSTTVYDPWGTRISTNSPTAPTTPLGLAMSMMGWKGSAALPVGDDFVIMGAREYSPTAGRFLQRDPIVNGSLNPYEFAGSDPWNSSDPSGALSKGKWAGMGASLAIGITLGILIALFCPPASLAGAALAGAVVGGTSSFASSSIEQAVDNQGTVNWAQVGVNTAIGAGIGAAVGAATYGLGSAYASAAEPDEILIRGIDAGNEIAGEGNLWDHAINRRPTFMDGFRPRAGSVDSLIDVVADSGPLLLDVTPVAAEVVSGGFVTLGVGATVGVGAAAGFTAGAAAWGVGFVTPQLPAGGSATPQDPSLSPSNGTIDAGSNPAALINAG